MLKKLLDHMGPLSPRLCLTALQGYAAVLGTKHAYVCIRCVTQYKVLVHSWLPIGGTYQVAVVPPGRCHLL
jgi:hypothetical protein